MHPSQFWALSYATLVGWTLHPGYNKPGTEKLTLANCAVLADYMQAEYEKRFNSWQQ